MNRSLRWRLQGWYAIVLLAVIGGFATLQYIEVRTVRFHDIDAALTGDALYLDNTLRRFPPPLLGGDRPDDHPPPPFDGPPDGGPDRRPPDRPSPRRDRPGPPWPNRERLLADLTPPARPDGSAARASYYAVWRSDGTILKAADLPDGVGPPTLPEDSPPATVRLSWRGEYREAAVLAPGRSRILVGQSVAKERAELNRFAWQLAAAGAAVLAVGLVGGWLASARILRPLASISATASAISETNLSERIDVTRIDLELEDLAGVLNGTFDRLEAAFDRQARFTADASHELRTPLTVMSSQAQLALARPRSADEYRKSLDECLRAAERMTVLVEGLLMLARADAGKLELRHEAVDLKRVTADALTELRPLADSLGIKLGAKLAPVTVTGDSLRLGQVVTNLVTNAIRYNRPGGQVRVQIASADGEAVLTVEDTGYGIPKDDQPHVFERFFRVSKDRSRVSGGSGLGLAITKSIVAGHGGSITFTSAVDKGTTFEVRLPLPGQSDLEA
jgi:two-component system, OmpR family, sensor kinase